MHMFGYLDGESSTAPSRVLLSEILIRLAALVESVNGVIRAGGSITLPRMAVQGIGWVTYGKDTEGNLFGMMQEDPSAHE